MPANLPSHSDMVTRILGVYNRASGSDQNQMLWYKAANSFVIGLADKYGVSAEQAAAVVAVLSPRLEWGLNMRYAEQFLATGNAPTFFSTLAKLRRLADGATLADVQNGRKVASFADNILRPTTSEAVTLDRHAVDIATGTTDDAGRKVLDRKGAYDAISAAYVEAAAIVGLRPCELQAVTWVAHKRAKSYSPIHQQFNRKGAM